MNIIIKWIKLLSRKAQKESPKIYNEKIELFESRMDDTFWTPALIMWINSEKDAAMLAVTSQLLNCHEWPAWLPSKPIWYDMSIKEAREKYPRSLTQTCDLIETLRKKSELICPNLDRIIWASNYYKTFSQKEAEG